jgi:hypothetical protein
VIGVEFECGFGVFGACGAFNPLLTNDQMENGCCIDGATPHTMTLISVLRHGRPTTLPASPPGASGAGPRKPLQDDIPARKAFSSLGAHDVLCGQSPPECQRL